MSGPEKNSINPRFPEHTPAHSLSSLSFLLPFEDHTHSCQVQRGLVLYMQPTFPSSYRLSGPMLSITSATGYRQGRWCCWGESKEKGKRQQGFLGAETAHCPRPFPRECGVPMDRSLLRNFLPTTSSLLLSQNHGEDCPVSSNKEGALCVLVNLEPHDLHDIIS